MAAAAVGKKNNNNNNNKRRAVVHSSLVESASNLLARSSFLNSDCEDPALKLVENATWLAIFLLVAWEFLINLPFFHRAAPMAPIVYDFFM
jgi:hypothetical protein